jgi:hypothetical protein
LDQKALIQSQIPKRRDVRETEEVKVGSKYCWKKFFPSYLAFTNCKIHPIHFPYLEQKLRGLSWTYKERTKERAACGWGGGGVWGILGKKGTKVLSHSQIPKRRDVRETEEVKVGSKYCWKKKFFPSYLAFTNCKIHSIHFPYLEQKFRGLSWTYKERAACG